MKYNQFYLISYLVNQLIPAKYDRPKTKNNQKARMTEWIGCTVGQPSKGGAGTKVENV
jgi:hypothetical protein